MQPMSALLDSLSELECYLLKTDMQQMDFTAVKSAGHLLKRCHYVVSEVFCSGLTYCEFPFQIFLMYLRLATRSTRLHRRRASCKPLNCPCMTALIGYLM